MIGASIVAGQTLRQVARPFALGVSLLVGLAYVVALATEFDFASAARVRWTEPTPGFRNSVSLAWGINGMGAVMIALSVFLVRW